MKQAKLWELLKKWQSEEYRWVDLTHTFDAHSPHWSGFPKMKVEEINNYITDNYFTQVFTFVGQYGTHIDAPFHFDPLGRTLEKIKIEELILPLCVIDVHKQVEECYDYALNLKDVKNYEKKYEKIPEGAFVAMRSDWYKRWPDNKKCMQFDKNGNVHYPGWDIEAVEFLVKERNIKMIGHEGFDTAPPSAEKKPLQCESWLLKQDRMQIEVMANLDKVPEFGSIIFCAFPKILGASGFPVRCFALCENKIDYSFI